MIRSIETTGKTKELAIRAALEQLKLTEDDITYEILELGRSGFLGIGAVPARVRVSYDDGQSEPTPVKTQPVKAPAKKPETAKKSEPKKAEPRQYAAGSQEKEVESFLRGLLERMGVECTIDISEREGGGLEVKLDSLIHGTIVTNNGSLTDNHSRSVINKQTFSNGCSRMDFNSGFSGCSLGNVSCSKIMPLQILFMCPSIA